VSHGSVTVFYRTKVKTIIGEFEIVRVEDIEKPTTTEAKRMYEKAFGYPVTLYDGTYYSSIHYYFKNLKIYTPHIPYTVFEKFLEEHRGSYTGLPHGSFLYLDEDEIKFLRNQTSATLIADIIDSKFDDPFE